MIKHYMEKNSTKWLLLILSLVIGHFVNSQTFTNGVVATGYGSSNMFCGTDIGPDGKFYAIWKYGSFINSANPQTPYFQVKRWDAGTWTTIGGFKSTDIPNQLSSSTYTMLGDRVGFEIDASGTYHVAIQNYITADGGVTIEHAVTYCKSTNGTSWAFTVLQDNNAVVNLSYSDVQLELDNNDRPHVTFKINDASSSTISDRRHHIRHFAFNGTSWVGETALTSYGVTKMNEITSYAYTIDKNGKSHIAASLESNDSGTDGSLVYLNNVSGSWTTPTFIITGATGAAASVSQDIVVDANDKVHIVSRSLAYAISYSTNKTNSFVVKSLGISGTFDIQSLAINASGELFSFYNQNTGTNTGVVQYAFMNTSGVWATGNVMTGNSRTGQYTSVEFSDSHEAMMLFDHFTGTGSPSYGPPDNPRQLQYATAKFTPPATTASVTTAAISTFGQTTATLGGNVTSDGGASVTERGIVYATTASPTTANSKVQIGTGTGIFSQSVTGLTAGTKYYVRAYAINSEGTAYGTDETFTTLNTPTLAVSGTLLPFSTCSGTISASQSFTVGGSFLTANVVVTAPTGYEVSLSSGVNYSNSVTIIPISGTVSATVVYVRLSIAATGAPSGNIAVTSTGASSSNKAVTGTVKNKTTGSITQSGCGKLVINNQTYASSGVYTQTLVNKVGCDSILTLNLTLNQVPDASTTVTDPIIKANTSGASYKWFECSNASVILSTSQIFAPISTGSYGVIVTANNCDNTSACSLVSVVVTDVNDIVVQSNLISVYPNPVSDLIHVKLADDMSGYVSITNISGQLVYENSDSGKVLDIVTKDFENGVYFLKVGNIIQRIAVVK